MTECKPHSQIEISVLFLADSNCGRTVAVAGITSGRLQPPASVA